MLKWFCYVMDIGEQMLISGAEVHRVEESIDRMCHALGAVRVDVFIITSSMVVTIQTDDGKTYTQTRRVTTTNFDFERLHYLNDLSRQICENKIDESEIENRLKKVNECKRFSKWCEIICYGVIAAAFALFFGGSVMEMLTALFVGTIARFSVFLAEKIISNKIFGKFFAAALVTLLAFFAVKIKWIPTVDKVIMGNIMTLIPGIGLTNAIRDLFTGDSIAGFLRSIEAVLTALSIAAGYFLVAVLGGFAV